ncbi:hypothetical protein H2200_000073 [Cladophialophora chaetospira]|uniref:AAA+ ATPase domain-containing protein n=1 Tax=Cladophialophora chaetospira TaxID=386627 RepID=A0AA38XMQ6_9EURO|nr:hypothetical protein H2200_000073 [Cladophialophora chaetospira]
MPTKLGFPNPRAQKAFLNKLQAARSGQDAPEESPELLTRFLSGGIGAALIAQGTPYVREITKRYPRLTIAANGTAIALFLGWAILKRSHDILKFGMDWGMASITISEDDYSLNDSVRDWLRTNAAFKSRSALSAMSSTFARNFRGLKTTRETKVVFEGSSPLQFFRAQGRWFVFTQESNGAIRIYCMGHSPKPIEELIHFIQTSLDEKREISVYEPNLLGPAPHWEQRSAQAPRDFDSVVLDADLKKVLVDEIGEYLHPDAADDYAARGIAYRRGYLLYGKPGCGKTTFAMAVAGHFQLSIYTISLTDPMLTDNALLRLFQSLQPGTLILLEDVDCAGLDRGYSKDARANVAVEDDDDEDDKLQKAIFGMSRAGPPKSKTAKTGKKPQQPASKVTLSGLLNAIDGPSAPMGHLLIMSSNCPEKLDDALIRPGRVARRVEFKHASREQIRDMFLKLYLPRNSAKPAKWDTRTIPALAEKFADIVPADAFSPASVQERLLEHMTRPDLAVEKAAAWVVEQLGELPDELFFDTKSHATVAQGLFPAPVVQAQPEVQPEPVKMRHSIAVAMQRKSRFFGIRSLNRKSW